MNKIQSIAIAALSILWPYLLAWLLLANPLIR